MTWTVDVCLPANYGVNAFWITSYTNLSFLCHTILNYFWMYLYYCICDYNALRAAQLFHTRALSWISVTRCVGDATSALLINPPQRLSLGRRRPAETLDIDFVQLLLSLSFQIGRTCNRLKCVDEMLLPKWKGNWQVVCANAQTVILCLIND